MTRFEKYWGIYTGKGLARKQPEPIERRVTGSIVKTDSFIHYTAYECGETIRDRRWKGKRKQKILGYTECPRRKGPNFGTVFLRSNYTDITQNTYTQSSVVTEILAREV
jgi:hypothetical protein